MERTLCDFTAGLTCPRCGYVARTPRTFRRCGPPVTMGLGDMTAAALESIGITKERVTAWLGEPCACPERQEWLNEVGRKFGIGVPP
jgi:hypothetical protein